MANMRRVKAELTGAGVTGGGVSTFYFLEPGSANLANAVGAFYDAIKANFPSNVTITIQSSGDLIESTTGALTGVWNQATPAVEVDGTSAGEYAQGVGMRVRWETNGIVGGRRVRGSTFLVPLSGASYTADGTPLNGLVSAVQIAADTLLGVDAQQVVWSRPRVDPETGLPLTGITSPVLSASVPDKISWLQSRRR